MGKLESAPVDLSKTSALLNLKYCGKIRKFHCRFIKNICSAYFKIADRCLSVCSSEGSRVFRHIVYSWARCLQSASFCWAWVKETDILRCSFSVGTVLSLFLCLASSHRINSEISKVSYNSNEFSHCWKRRWQLHYWLKTWDTSHLETTPPQESFLDMNREL